MYVVTFYSYKGGVGRTLALVNTAAALAEAGKRVLLVDFDLEAPGLCSYPDFKCASGKKGVVEYVSQYLQTNEAPEVEAFIERASLNDHPIWVMPAGNQTKPAYADRLAAINWEDLYEQRSGFLMFEDLKQQWKSYEGRGFDYVLVDSRTGHTDVGGICTRQLPDAVVLLFLPNDQNILGLAPIAHAIRRQEFERQKRIQIHFCASNVPYLDDEDGILKRKLERAQEVLGYSSIASCIHHYQSLELLEQQLFAVQHPQSRLAREYAALHDAIVEGNIEDRDGVVRAIRRATRFGPDSADLVYALPLEEMQVQHGADPEVASNLAQAHWIVGDFDQQVAALDIAIAGRYSLERNLVLRALAYRRFNRNNEAGDDLLQVLSMSDISGASLVLAAETLRQMQTPNWNKHVINAPSLGALSVPEQRRLVQIFMSERGSLQTAIDFIETVLKDTELPRKERWIQENNRVLALIGLRRFKEAMSALGDPEALLAGEDDSTIFNYAIAEWGETGSPSQRMFESVVDVVDAMADPNYHQCLALAYAIVGNREAAFDRITQARAMIENYGRAFSCWSYLQVERTGFMRDLDEMERALRDLSRPFQPAFFAKTLH